MTKFFSKCEACKKRAFVIKHRKYFDVRGNLEITSKSLQCKACYKKLNQLLGNH